MGTPILAHTIARGEMLDPRMTQIQRKKKHEKKQRGGCAQGVGCVARSYTCQTADGNSERGTINKHATSTSTRGQVLCALLEGTRCRPPSVLLTLCGIRLRAGDALASVAKKGGPVGFAEAGVSRLIRSSTARSMAYLCVRPMAQREGVEFSRP